MKLIFLLLVILIGCSSNNVGTRVTNPPSQPTQSYVPNFETVINEAALISTTDSEQQVSSGLMRTQLSTLETPYSSWSEIVLNTNSPILRAREARESLQAIGDELLDLINQDTDFDVYDGTHTYTLAETILIDEQADWRVEVDVIEETYIRMVFYHPSDDQIWGYYIVTTNEDGTPTGGHFVYINRTNSSGGSLVDDGEYVYFALVHDFSGNEDNHLVVRADYKDPSVSDETVVFNLHYECQTGSDECTLEYLENNEPSSNSFAERTFSNRTNRTTYDDATLILCSAGTTYSESGTTLATTIQWTGPEAPTDSTVTSGQCSVDTQVAWGNTVYPSTDLPIRPGEGGDGGSAEQFLENNGDITQFETLAPIENISNWPQANF